MKHIEIIIPVEAVPKARVRVVVSSKGYLHGYTPARTSEYEEYLRWLFKSERTHMFKKGIPLKVDLICYLERPKRSKTAYPVGRPDADNYLKGCLDAAKGILFCDDSQIVDCHVRKEYAVHKGYSKLTVEEIAE